MAPQCLHNRESVGQHFGAAEILEPGKIVFYFYVF
jgi:hypothetical protein